MTYRLIIGQISIKLWFKVSVSIGLLLCKEENKSQVGSGFKSAF